MLRHYDNFVITGMSRCGTTFLSHVLSFSDWDIHHEPANPDRKEDAIKRFYNHHYGEVNSLIRYWLPILPAAKKAIILRHPREIVVSVYNYCCNRGHKPKRPDGQWDIVIRIGRIWELLDHYIETGYTVFRFEQFTTDVNELYKIAQWAGITNLNIPSDIVKHKQNSVPKIINDYDELHPEIRALIDNKIDWFEAKYYPNCRKSLV